MAAPDPNEDWGTDYSMFEGKPNFDFTGKVVLSSGTTTGIGLKVALEFCEAGAKVVISSRREENVFEGLKFLHDQGFAEQASGLAAHVARAEDRRRLIKFTLERYGAIHILYLNAGVNPSFGLLLECDEERWDKVYEVNVLAPFLFTQEIVPYMSGQKSACNGSNGTRPVDTAKASDGVILYMSTIGAYDLFQDMAIYQASKAALIGTVKMFSRAFQRDGYKIRVNAIAAGAFDTKFGAVLWSDEERREDELSFVPMNRVGNPEECAATALFLCSDRSEYITGETVAVAGGKYSRH